MKNFQRDNARFAKTNNPQGRINQSQSPPQNKLLKKIQHIHKDGPNKHEFSLQNNYVRPEQKEEVQDFRVEIEKRYQKSNCNKNYLFPFQNDDDESDFSEESSLSSLQYVTVYDLGSQNHKQKLASKPHFNQKHTESSSQYLRTEPNEVMSDNSSEVMFTDQSDDHIPIEIRVRDKSSSTYLRLIKLLEQNPMFSHNSTNTYVKRTDKKENNGVAKWQQEGGVEVHAGRNNAPNNLQIAKQELQTNFTTQVSTIDSQKGFLKDNYMQNERPKMVARDIKSAERRADHAGMRVATEPDKPSKLESNSFIEKQSTMNEMRG